MRLPRGGSTNRTDFSGVSWNDKLDSDIGATCVTGKIILSTIFSLLCKLCKIDLPTYLIIISLIIIMSIRSRF